MAHYVLLGAGFSRNWGGWLTDEVFEYLLGCPEVLADGDLQRRLWRVKDRGGFEAALEELQAEAARSGDRTTLEKLERAIQAMFAAMDGGFRNGRGTIFEFEFARGTSLVKDFLHRFDAIFTLNQDLLLERHYFNEGHGLVAPQRWSGYTIPGMRPIVDNNAPFTGERVVPAYAPDTEFQLPARMQPFYKLHGSSNWRDAHGRLIIALGGNKAGTIQANSVLNQYAERFKAALSSGDARLMIIGYGFQDSHINTILLDAATRQSLKLFVIDLLGVDISHPNRKAPLRGPNPFADGIIGVSRRPLSASFGEDRVEREKILRFFA